jgi:arginase family enzyme
LRETTEWFLKKNKTIIIIGGTQDLTVPAFEALTETRKKVNLTVCDAMLDFDINEIDYNSRAWLNQITVGHKKNLEDLTIMGIQNYLITESLENKIKKDFYEIIRLSEIRGDELKRTEVPLRDSDILSFDMRSISGNFTFAENIVSPHGIAPYEACKICHYAGLSPKLSIFGVFETIINDKFTFLNYSALSAQMIWHFIEGIIGRFPDFPEENADIYKTYMVILDAVGKEIRFYNNNTNDRWWMEVPSDKGVNKIISCDHEEYLKAMDNEIPDKWWRVLMKNRE